MGEAQTRQHGDWCKWKRLIQWQMFCRRSTSRHDFVHFSQFKMRPKIHYQRNAASLNIVILGAGETWIVELHKLLLGLGAWTRSYNDRPYVFLGFGFWCASIGHSDRKKATPSKQTKKKIQTQCNDADLTTRGHRQKETFRCMRENLKLLPRTIFPRFRQLMRWHGAPSSSRPASRHAACV